VQQSSRDDLLSELLAEIQAIEADIGAAQGAAAQIDQARSQIEAACQDASAVLRALHTAALPPDDARRAREATQAHLQDQRAVLAHAAQVRRDAAARVAHAALRMRAVRRILEHLLAMDETA
jgi:hypothetical protein